MSEKKDKLLTMKVTEAEKQKWQEIAKSFKLSLGELIRQKLNGTTPARKVKVKIKQVDPDLLFEINAIGNNLNQIARRLNEGEKFDVLPLLYSMEAHLTEVLNAHKVHS